MDPASEDGGLVYREILSLPHEPGNMKPSSFAQVTTATGRVLRATITHLLVGCDGSLVSARNATCVRTVDGDEDVVSMEMVSDRGLFTAFTEHDADNALIVVNGFIASPFALFRRFDDIDLHWGYDWNTVPAE